MKKECVKFNLHYWKQETGISLLTVSMSLIELWVMVFKIRNTILTSLDSKFNADTFWNFPLTILGQWWWYSMIQGGPELTYNDLGHNQNYRILVQLSNSLNLLTACLGFCSHSFLFFCSSLVLVSSLPNTQPTLWGGEYVWSCHWTWLIRYIYMLFESQYQAKFKTRIHQSYVQALIINIEKQHSLWRKSRLLDVSMDLQPTILVGANQA